MSLVRQALVIPFTVITGHEVLNGGPQRRLSEPDQLLQAGLSCSKQDSLMLRTNLSA
jgi:hypothetical protein